MNAIQPIETRYKGLRFRSRLEARWALFYDLANISWTYEPDPVSINGEGYLPDFALHLPGDAPLYHEVKPANLAKTLRPPRVYLAGKMSEEHDWRGPQSALIREERRGVFYDDFDDSSWRSWLNASRRTTLGTTEINLIGPFPVGCDHGCAHRPESIHLAQTCSGIANKYSIFKTCETTLREAEIVCAHLSTPDAYGTLVEIGMARSTDRAKISLTLDEQLLERVGRAKVHYDDSFHHELWFVSQAANQTEYVKGYEHARSVHEDFIQRHTHRDFRRISALGTQTGSAAITFGDPWELATTSSEFIWGKTSLQDFCRRNLAAAEQARAHRFDGR